ncbi:unnamed protein product [Bursaphelenchus okinawaensis]|uniref:Ground-like domain-containing protein n=1 Tax=Bursaphelenchus okinawaensis TaxID=465554 RepID=A0A811L619_9BILA|nr:unnamed protein product [Bursaphelenchus okinawaensis]CAG9118436.1 unnamed protein product [Bursaphelenchus okinawaensis]
MSIKLTFIFNNLEWKVKLLGTDPRVGWARSTAYREDTVKEDTTSFNRIIVDAKRFIPAPPPPPRQCGPPPPCNRPPPQACPPCDCSGIQQTSYQVPSLLTNNYRGTSGNYVKAPIPPLLPPPPPPPAANSYLVPQLTNGVLQPSSSLIESYTLPPRHASTSSSGHGHGHHHSKLSSKSVDDVYDEVLPNDNSLSDISFDSKRLSPSDIFIKRNRFLKQLRNRALRQFSGNSKSSLPQLDERSYLPSVCNNEKLAKVMVKAMTNDITASKKLVRKATEMAFDGQKFDVLCANGDFSYSVYAKQYCEATRGNITCFAFI